MMFRNCAATAVRVLNDVDCTSIPMFRTAKKTIASPKKRNLYAVVSGLHWDEPNDNGDYFGRDELLKLREDGRYTYQTWIGCPNCINHDLNIVVGKILDTAPVFEENSIDMLLEVERGKYRLAGHDLVDMIRTGKQTGVSMGVIVQWSECSICDNVARTESEWCKHLRYHKGQKDPDTGRLVYEINHDLHGLELSWICTGAPADQKAVLRKVLNDE